MSDTKWADVAHYYAKSNLSIIVGKFDHGPEMGMIFSKGLHENCEWAEHGIWCQIENGAFISEWGSHKPILRHRDDMTEAEDNECMLVHTRWISNEEFKNVIWSLTKQHKTFDQYSTHWLISHGFDVFGLIESGQAIRKEAGNG